MMGLTKQKGNMYPWVTHMHTHLRGQCFHGCIYCYVNRDRFGGGKYNGPLWLAENQLEVPYSIKDESKRIPRTIFIEHCNDMFAEDVPHVFIRGILDHCKKYPLETYVFQTKNPRRMLTYLDEFPPKYFMGVTIETDRSTTGISNAPWPVDRWIALMDFWKGQKDPFIFKNHLFITIEPILDFDIAPFIPMLKAIRPAFINIGADSKGHNLQEPSVEKVERLISELQEAGIEIREKHNLERLRKEA